MSALRDLLEEACKRGGVADCEFFINKRDYPHLKYNEHTKEPVEPYGFIFDKDDRNPDEDLCAVVSCGAAAAAAAAADATTSKHKASYCQC
eukprot:19129-Heterococcus_DN1.PRE.3